MRRSPGMTVEYASVFRTAPVPDQEQPGQKRARAERHRAKGADQKIAVRLVRKPDIPGEESRDEDDHQQDTNQSFGRHPFASCPPPVRRMAGRVPRPKENLAKKTARTFPPGPLFT